MATHQRIATQYGIDAKLRTTQHNSHTLRAWLNSINPGVHKPAPMCLN
ncbi:MAG: hypothetical protein H7Z72_25945 [Bacteroidetes bacterium]|nr:hypothetical protein [Fibrella sp.]